MKSVQREGEEKKKKIFFSSLAPMPLREEVTRSERERGGGGEGDKKKRRRERERERERATLSSHFFSFVQRNKKTKKRNWLGRRLQSAVRAMTLRRSSAARLLPSASIQVS